MQASRDPAAAHHAAMTPTPQSSETISNRINSLRERIARAEAQRAGALDKISQASVDDAPINGALRERDEAGARIDSLTQETRRLEEEELPRALEAEARAARARALTAARELHARRVKVARKFDAAAAKAAEALSELRASDAEYAAAMNAAGVKPGAHNWQRTLWSALWWAKAPDRKWSHWRGETGQAQPALAMLLGLPAEMRARAAPLAEQFEKFSPPADPDPLEIRPTPENKAARTAAQADAERAAAARVCPEPPPELGDAAMAEVRERRRAEYEKLERRRT